MIEQRWSPVDQPELQHNGDRLYVATGSGVNVYDLEQSNAAALQTIDGPYVAVALDPDTHTLYLGQADGTIAQLPTTGFDDLRASGRISAAT